jgi:predicted Rdx family selenoprotein
MQAEDLLALLSDFGPGIMTWRQPDGLRTRPVRPVLDHGRGRISCVAECTWFLGAPAGCLEVACSFVDEFKGRALTLDARGVRSLLVDDIAGAWTLAMETRYPDGPEQRGLICLHLAPQRAAIWDLARGTCHEAWAFDPETFLRR